MNLFDCVTCNQYYELVKTGRDGKKALLNGNLLNAACVLLLLLTLCNFALMNNVVAENFFATLASVFGERSGKGLGELIAIPVFGVIYLIIKNTIGTTAHFEHITTEFDSLSETDKKAIFRRGSIFVFACLGLFVITFLYSSNYNTDLLQAPARLPSHNFLSHCIKCLFQQVHVLLV